MAQMAQKRQLIHRFHRFAQIGESGFLELPGDVDSSAWASAGALGSHLLGGAVPAPPLISGQAGDRLRRAQACRVGAHLCHL